MRTPYSRAFFRSVASAADESSREVVPRIVELISPTSVVDVGCGTGDWLATFVRAGVSDVLGVDGPYVPTNQLTIPASRFYTHDLTLPIQLDRRFDLVLSLEVAEHLDSAYADQFVASLTRLGSVVLFSAAVPGQGGEHHVNEQWPDYWARRFGERSFTMVDGIRGEFWENPRVACWYAQNMLLFVAQEELQHRSSLQLALAESDLRGLPLVHPRTLAAAGSRRLPLGVRQVEKVAGAWWGARRAASLDRNLDTGRREQSG